MNRCDHSDCSTEIRTCPKHEAVEDRTTPESGFVEIDISSVKPRMALPDCMCGCSEVAPGSGIGWCRHCDHVYADYNTKLEDLHFAHHCPGAPASAKQEAGHGWCDAEFAPKHHNFRKGAWNMRIGEPLRTIVVDPLQLPLPLARSEPAPCPAPMAATETEPEQEPAIP